ncbi:5-formyltetrahydrofolate cyclo-ligase [uncultured Vagococcus sp.]|uniref:5-formyltetrahydrofolate cyclo-ligase n=1 Tax=uncultured Vagococcus sp. TaxID=189676 RepID=UPI0028D5A420|nr:5-formyltetrahydrofolate cyclo-ligase [uncultured Vagococcus sp.]
MNKATVRQETLAKLRKLGLDIPRKKQQERAVLSQLFESTLWQNATSVGLTLSMGLEFSTQKIIERAWQEGKITAVPKTAPQRKMDFIKITSGTIYEESNFGVREPLTNDIMKGNQLDLLIVPGVAFRLDGYRVGFGGGYYDRYLADYTGQTCSLVFQEQLNQEWKPETLDQPVGTLFMA